MAVLTFTIEPDEVLGLNALVELGRTAEPDHPAPQLPPLPMPTSRARQGC